MEPKRRAFQGVLNILSFNRHYYYYGLLVLGLVIFIGLLSKWPPALLLMIIAAFMYGLVMPLIVSAYVYDLSGYYELPWLKSLFTKSKKVDRIVNVNAGFDETSYLLNHRFPDAEINVFDFYNAMRHTEPAIVRARKASLVYPNTKHIESDAIPLKDASADLVFLLSAIHEIRTLDEKVRFLKECHRICKKDGHVIMVEHLRDFPNFLAFTIGFTHFFSKSTWKRAFERAGFSTFQETKFTPFMSVFNCCP
jgi:ubiquinone/menaquinone biosynthesis C-methylase UbiE